MFSRSGSARLRYSIRAMIIAVVVAAIASAWCERLRLSCQRCDDGLAAGRGMVRHCCAMTKVMATWMTTHLSLASLYFLSIVVKA